MQVGNLNAVQTTACGVQTITDFYCSFWSPANRLKSPLERKPLLSRGHQFMFVDGDFDDSTDDILFEECFLKWDLAI